MKKKKEKKETKQQTVDRIKKDLESIFTGVNEVSEELATTLVKCIKDLELLTGGPFIKDEGVAKKSKAFADKHKKFCLDIGKKFDARDLQYFIHISDPMGGNTISYGHMDNDIMMKSISGAMIMSKHIFQGVLKEIGMPEHCIECMTDVPEELKSEYQPKDIPQRLKYLLEEKFGGELIGVGTFKVPIPRKPVNEEEDKENKDK